MIVFHRKNCESTPHNRCSFGSFHNNVLARDICLARYMLSPVRLSGIQVDQSETVEVMIMKFSTYGSPVLLVLRGKFHPEILTGSPSGASKKGGLGNKPFSSFKLQVVNISKTAVDTSKVTVND